ncbi:type I-E CRISPR-associated protein Cas6/Cse3/CasE [Lactobacillus sp. ESL0791]|uniref:type I-E CRISPR-associated protein Cas6/Cse3/CasE n=1 Tax=Lactobacillus sp. ESL0791 TaxID=2983234 RepID=UPI0023F6E786|nr:type I-E CRISPR-associated protein Cas6/Cse3/CasE [Lactobacillus sp. ESL0791]MDF7639255.1 type I-E CRISPR-associated protein Cas6/Cse3/CasE [Lactobacillus sp. ESL0791]
MYLSRVEIDVNNRQKTKDLTQLSAFHGWVEQSFPDEIKAGKRLRHLWRIDQLAGKTYLLLLSENIPDKQQLLRYGVADTFITKSYDRMLNGIKQEQLMQFRLTANPTHTVSEPGKKQGRVFPHVTVEQQLKWLIGRSEKLGFQLVTKDNKLSFDIVGRDWPLLSHKGKRRVRLSRVTFEGILRITDADKFKQALINGIGREKAFGMGLMTVIPRTNND